MFSRALASLFAKLLDIIVVEFFDDFTQLESEETAESAQEALEAMIDLLGWELATEEKKRKKFSKQFVALGVVIDLDEIQSGIVKLRNKPGRIEGIEDQLKILRVKRRLGFKDALSLRGKISFAEGQHYGRIAAPAAFILSRWQTVSL